MRKIKKHFDFSNKVVFITGSEGKLGRSLKNKSCMGDPTAFNNFESIRFKGGFWAIFSGSSLKS